MAEEVFADIEVSTNMEEPEWTILSDSLWTFCPRANFYLKDMLGIRLIFLISFRWFVYQLKEEIGIWT